MIKSYKDLKIWQDSLVIVQKVYKVVSSFPTHENFALSSQICRAVVSIPSNIAEGKARQHAKEFRQFLYIALGSIAELETQLIISRDLGYIQTKNFDEITNDLDTLGRMISFKT